MLMATLHTPTAAALATSHRLEHCQRLGLSEEEQAELLVGAVLRRGKGYTAQVRAAACGPGGWRPHA